MRNKTKTTIITILSITIVGLVSSQLVNNRWSYFTSHPLGDSKPSKIQKSKDPQTQINYVKNIAIQPSHSPPQRPAHLSSNKIEMASELADFKRYSLGPKFLRTFFALKQKALLSNQDKQEIRSILMDEKMIHKSFELLTQIQSKYDEFSEKSRIMAIKFLGDAIIWKQNPSYKDLIHRTETYLLKNQLSNSADIQTKKSVAGDMIELFLKLYDRDKDRAMELLTHPNRETNTNLYKYALNKYRNTTIK